MIGMNRADDKAKIATPAPQMPDRQATADLGEVQLDLDRRRRCGYPEVVFAEGKPVATLQKVFRRLLARGIAYWQLEFRPKRRRPWQSHFPAAAITRSAAHFELMLRIQRRHRTGEAKLQSLQPARPTWQWLRKQRDRRMDGRSVNVIQDVGVAGPHRLPDRLMEFEDADAVVVVAGMEGALPSVVGGYVSCPVIAVPTSVGYGASLGGIAALLAMLNSCAANVTVVNIDAGFKGGYVAGLIANRAARNRAGSSS